MVVQTLVNILIVYLVVGLLFALSFISAGVSRIDAAARGAGTGFRLLLLPGAMALWPWLAWRWMRAAPPPRERNAHRDAAREVKG